MLVKIRLQSSQAAHALVKMAVIFCRHENYADMEWGALAATFHLAVDRPSKEICQSFENHGEQR